MVRLMRAILSTRTSCASAVILVACIGAIATTVEVCVLSQTSSEACLIIKLDTLLLKLFFLCIFLDYMDFILIFDKTNKIFVESKRTIMAKFTGQNDEQAALGLAIAGEATLIGPTAVGVAQVTAVKLGALSALKTGIGWGLAINPAFASLALAGVVLYLTYKVFSNGG